MKRYTWFGAASAALLIDTEREIVIGSIIPQANGECIIRYGRSANTEPMQEDVVEAQANLMDTIFTAAGRIVARLHVWIRDEDNKALSRFVDDLLSNELKPEYLEGCKNG